MKASEWSVTSQSVCTASQLSAFSASAPVVIAAVTNVVTITSFSEVNSSVQIDITCTYVLGTNSSSTTELVSSLITYDSTTNGSEINKWTHDSTVNVAISANAGSVGISSEWTFDLIPDNASVAAAVDGHMKFKVNQNLPMGTVLEITYPENITSALSGAIHNECWSKIAYTSCTITGAGKLQLVLNEDVSSLNVIELYVT